MLQGASISGVIPMRRSIFFALYALASLPVFSEASHAQGLCRNVAITISDAVIRTVRRVKTAKVALGLAAYQQQLSTGTETILSGSSVAYAAAKGQVATVQASGVVDSVVVAGDNTTTFKSVTIFGHLGGLPGATNGNGNFKIAVTKLRRKAAHNKGGQQNITFSGKVSYKITDAVTGKVLFSAAPAKFSKLRTFGYQWKNVPCGGSPGGGGGPQCGVTVKC
jgi:hypothetical protein